MDKQSPQQAQAPQRQHSAATYVPYDQTRPDNAWQNSKQNHQSGLEYDFTYKGEDDGTQEEPLFTGQGYLDKSPSLPARAVQQVGIRRRPAIKQNDNLMPLASC